MGENFLIDPLAFEMMRDATHMSERAYERKWAEKLEAARIATMLHRHMPRPMCSPLGSLAHKERA